MQTSPYHPAFVAYEGGGLGSLQRPAGFGELGLDPTAAKAGSAVASYAAGTGAATAAGAMGAAGYATIGAAAGPIGAVVGLVVGIVVTKLLTKNYLNVGQMNAAEAAEIAAFNQYRRIAGQAPGRQFGLAAMRAVWKGALHSGFFPLNQETQCFHDGCSAHPGNASLIDIALDGGSSDRNTFPDMLPKFLARVRAPAAVVRLAPVAARSTLAVRPGGGALRGLGAFGTTPTLIRPMPVPVASFPGTPEAVVFIDSFFIPANSSGSPCSGHPCYWAAPRNATEHQILYDVADAYLAQQAFPSTPFVAVQAAKTSQQAPAKVLPAASTVAPTQGLIPFGNTSDGTPQYVRASDAGTIGIIPLFTYINGVLKQVGTMNNVRALPHGPVVVSHVNPVVNPLATPLLPVTQPGIAVGSGVVTTANSATNANLDAALGSNGYVRIGTSQDGYPIYQQTGPAMFGAPQAPPGSTFMYANGQLYPYASAAQVAVTGSAGNGITTPAGGLDPTTAALIANMLQQGATPSQATQAAATKLQARGVPVTPDVQAQLDYAAANPAAAGITSPTTLLLGLGAVVLIAFVARR